MLLAAYASRSNVELLYARKCADETEARLMARNMRDDCCERAGRTRPKS